MDILYILENYKAALGAFSIAVATVIAVFINLSHSSRTEHRLKKERNATFSSAIAAELLDNAHNLMELHHEIARKSGKLQRINQFKEFNLQVYQNVLTEIGRLGPALSFMIVDVYGDIQKIKKYLEFSADKEIQQNKEEILLDLQAVLAKVLTGSVVMSFYADYMLGPKWMASITNQRLLWLENTLDTFCQYIDKADALTSIYAYDSEGDFIDRLKNKEQKAQIIELFALAEKVLHDVPKKRAWKVQLILRAFSYKIQNTLIAFLDIEADAYIVKSETEYKEFLPQ